MDDVQHAQSQGLVHLNVPGLCWQGPREQLHGAYKWRRRQSAAQGTPLGWVLSGKGIAC
jgi:hypothetical protein